MSLTSTITNTTTDPSGTVVPNVPVSVSLVGQISAISPPVLVAGFRNDDLSEVVQTANTTSNASGVWSLALERNTNITPANSYYMVVENYPPASGGPKFWLFTVGNVNQTLQAAITVPLPPALTPSSFLTQAQGDARYVQAPGTFSGSVGTEVANGAGTAGAATTYSRGDHVHPAPTAAAALSRPTDTAAAGSSTSFAAADHRHSRETPQGNTVATAESTASAAYVDLTTVGPAVTVTTGTSALVLVGCLGLTTNVGSATWMAIAVSGATTIAAVDNNAFAQTSSTASAGVQATYCFVITGLNAGSNTFTAKYRTNGGTATFSMRTLAVWPL